MHQAKKLSSTEVETETLYTPPIVAGSAANPVSASAVAPASTPTSSPASTPVIPPTTIPNTHAPSQPRTWVVVLIILLLLCCFICASCFGGIFFLGEIGRSAGGNTGFSSASSYDPDNYQTVAGNRFSNNKLLSIVVSGTILNDEALDGSTGGLFGGSSVAYGYNIKNELYAAVKNTDIKGVILEINSPGGTITGSKAIADGVAYYREQTGNPVIAHISGIGASGSYWVAVAADSVYADPGSTVGSIGVVYGPFKYYDKVLSEGSLLGEQVLTQNGIETKYFTAGESKDVGSPYRRLTADEVHVLQTTVNNEYADFVSYVSSRRNLSEAKIRNQIKALVYDNKQAKELGLIDDSLNRQQAYAQLASRQNLLTEEDYQVIRQNNPADFWSSLLSGVTGKVGTPGVNGDAAAQTTLEQAAAKTSQLKQLHSVPLAIEPGWVM